MRFFRVWKKQRRCTWLTRGQRTAPKTLKPQIFLRVKLWLGTIPQDGAAFVPARSRSGQRHLATGTAIRLARTAWPSPSRLAHRLRHLAELASLEWRHSIHVV